MQAHGFGHRAQGQRLQVGHAATEEAFLLADEFGGDLEDRHLPLVERLHQPARVGQLFREPALVGLPAAGLAHFGVVAAVDDEAWQCRLVQCDGPAVGALGDQDVGGDRGGHAAAERQPRLGVIAAQLAQHVGEVFLVDAAELAQAGEFAARDHLQIADQLGHRRIVAIGFARLQGDALGERARADAGRIERLDQHQRLFGLGLGHHQVGGDLSKRHGQVSRLVEHIDQEAGDEQDAWGGIVARGLGADLGVEMFGEGGVGGAVALDVGRLAAGAGAGADVWAGFARGRGLGGIAGVAIGVERRRIDIERAVLAAQPLADQLIDW